MMFPRLSKLASTSRLTLQKSEVVKLPSQGREVQVLSGVAWITVDQRDIVLKSGERAKLPLSPNSAVISVLSKVPLVLDIIGQEVKLSTVQQAVKSPC